MTRSQLEPQYRQLLPPTTTSLYYYLRSLNTEYCLLFFFNFYLLTYYEYEYSSSETLGLPQLLDGPKDT
jgi:hypothetical protein